MIWLVFVLHTLSILIYIISIYIQLDEMLPRSPSISDRRMLYSFGRRVNCLLRFWCCDFLFIPKVAHPRYLLSVDRNVTSDYFIWLLYYKVDLFKKCSGFFFSLVSYIMNIYNSGHNYFDYNPHSFDSWSLSGTTLRVHISCI